MSTRSDVTAAFPAADSSGAHDLQDQKDHKDLKELSALFRLLSDKTRLNILMLLSDGERNVSSLCEQLGLPQPTVSHHLGLLRMNKIIANRRNGKQVFYALNGRVDVAKASGVRIGVENYSVQIVSKPVGAA